MLNLFNDYDLKIIVCIMVLWPEGYNCTSNTESNWSPVWTVLLVVPNAGTELVGCSSKVQGAEEEDLYARNTVVMQ